ncbi:MAG: zinc ribbon domain-containing protein [Chloroflexi bacterium CG_4_10_14_0_8_um_filter_46_9]|nr:MAG: zinc ribbon domain-containing protein [Chloroflexi bacterium CG15_BIG_FIL_POST_REV_8_21_14_020_46_15]PIZ26943.1 MAG: zinc ribbon domain-containing protein [Chloroflexi bacterium CG_4_10_14_0_8_um_filter_46_9]
MPIYEYQCTRCREKFEVRQAIGEDGAKLSCPKCHAPNPTRLFSSFFSPGSSTTEPSETSYPTCSSGVCGLPPM